MEKVNQRTSLPEEFVINRIQWLRGEKVILDEDLAYLYGVEVKRLKEAVRRNIERFPDDFLFELTWDEYHTLRSQFASLKRGQHPKFLPFAFTEQGVAMLSSVLHSSTAIQVNIKIMRAFVLFRKVLEINTVLAGKVEQLEKGFKNHDEKIDLIFQAIKELIDKGEALQEPRKRIGFRINEDEGMTPESF
jgi:hypothetical protein